jgi:hypothetical protein
MSHASLLRRRFVAAHSGKYPRQVEPRPSRLKPVTALVEQVDGILKARARRIQVTFGLRHKAIDRERRGAQRVAANLRYDVPQLVVRAPRLVRLAQREKHASVQIEPRRALEPVLWAELPQESRRTVRREGGIPAVECDMREPELGVGVELDLAEQLGRFLEPALAPPELCAAN